MKLLNLKSLLSLVLLLKLFKDTLSKELDSVEYLIDSDQLANSEENSSNGLDTQINDLENDQTEEFTVEFPQADQTRTNEESKSNEEEDHYEKRHNNFWLGFHSGFSLIFISEVGDKTFLLCIFYTMKIGALEAFLVTATTLGLLNAFWLCVGAALPILVYKSVINWLAVGIFLIIGVILLYQGCKMDDHKIIEEFHHLESEKQHEEEKEEEEWMANHKEELGDDDEEAVEPPNFGDVMGMEKNGDAKKSGYKEIQEPLIRKKPSDESQGKTSRSNKSHKTHAAVLYGFAFSLVFAECGDRSQITTIAIATLYNFTGVLMGSTLAHVFAALIAASMGHYIADHLTEKTVTIVGGFLFLAYAAEFVYSNITHMMKH